jgi:pimeloyl-ACP methyl ester carboxylesterase
MSVTCLAGAVVAQTPKAKAFKDESPHKSKFAKVSGVNLNYLDWGGKGPTLVMIHGIGDDPHVFDDLAGLLRDRFRIVAYARRGHGLSDSTGPYDGATLTEDMRQLLDHLGIKKASLMGWSMGGNEITAFAGKYPERVEKLVYMDAGYDWSRPAFYGPLVDMFVLNSPGAADMVSLDAYRKWYHAAWFGDIPWSNGLEAYLRDGAQPDKDGKLHVRPDAEAGEALFATVGNWPRDYTKVKAPALALYASVFFPTKRSDPALVKKLNDFEQNSVVPFRKASMEHIQRELRNVKVQTIANTCHMSIGVQDPKPLAATIREFLQN